jgi:hypothetical protein
MDIDNDKLRSSVRDSCPHVAPQEQAPSLHLSHKQKTNPHLLILIRPASDAAAWPLIHLCPFPHRTFIGCRAMPHRRPRRAPVPDTCAAARSLAIPLSISHWRRARR